MRAKNRYFDLNTWYRQRYGCRVHKISLDAGLDCPNRDGTLARTGCIYCNPRGSGTGANAKGHSITRQIAEAKVYLTKRYKTNKFIAYFQSFTNTYAPVDELARIYDEAVRDPDIIGLSIGTRPDCVDDEVLDLLTTYARKRLVWLEYGLQSIHDDTLARIQRGHDFDSFSNAVERTQGRNIFICAHVILGLPGETPRHMHQTASRLASMRIDGVKLHLLYVVRGTELETMLKQGTYTCLTQATYVSLVCDVIERLSAEMVIHRLTGDPHKKELVAPRWALEKSRTIEMINETLIQRNTRQGSRFNVNLKGCKSVSAK